MKRLTVVSADGHCGAPVEAYRPYMEAAYRDRIDDLAEEERITFAGMGTYRAGLSLPGVYEIGQEVVDLGFVVTQRLAALDAEGIAAEILFAGADHVTPFFSISNKPYPADIRAAGVRASAEVSAGSALDLRLAEHFNARAGFLKPMEQIEIENIDQRLDVDFNWAGAKAS